MSVDFGRTARDYGAHRAGFPAEFFSRARAMGVGLAGQRVVDLGTGTGTVARYPLSSGATARSASRNAASEHSASHFISGTLSGGRNRDAEGRSVP